MSRLTSKQRRARKRAEVGADTGERLVAVTVDARGVVTVPWAYRGRTVLFSYAPGAWRTMIARLQPVVRRAPRPSGFRFGPGEMWIGDAKVGTVREVSVALAQRDRYGYAQSLAAAEEALQCTGRLLAQAQG